jgi:hypothetical protein
MQVQDEFVHPCNNCCPFYRNLEKTQVVSTLPEIHDQFLEMTLKPLGHYQKLYSYTHAIAGFSVHMSSAQVMYVYAHGFYSSL